MIKLALCTTAALACLASASFAADPSAASPVPTAEQTAAATENTAVPSTGSFLARITADNRFAIESSELALKKSKSDAVLAFAKMMLADHSEAATKLKQVLDEAKLSAGPDALDARHRVVLDDLATKDGADFDKAYLDAQTRAHARAVALFESYAKGGDNARLKAFAGELLPVLRKHLEQVSQIKS